MSSGSAPRGSAPRGSAPGGQRAVRQLDNLFLDVLKALNDEVIRTSGDTAEQVLKLSGGFLSEQAQKAVGQFHSLYFGNAEVEKDKADVNADIDRLMDDIQGEMAKGKSADEISDTVVENQDLKAARLRLATIQKDLETLIRLDQGVKEKLVPVLSTMQFQDVVRQRLEHIFLAWEAIVSGMDEGSIADLELLAVEIEAQFTSDAEMALFYKTVLKKEPPAADLGSGSVWLDF